MPLEQYLPVIDNRRFEDIVTEARARIPRYAPEWTDLNDNDPGMALVQLLAWLTEMLIFRLGKVPELNYLKFLELIGIELQAAAPAQAEISFPVVESHSRPFVIVPARTQVSATPEGADAPVVFETQRAIHALTARLVDLRFFDGAGYEVLTQANADPDPQGSGFEPFGSAAPADAAFLIGFAYPDTYPGDKEVFPTLDLDLAVFTRDAGTSGAVTCGPAEAAAFPSARLAWEYWNGREWRTLSLRKDETVALTRSGHVLIRTPAPGEMVRAAIGAIADKRFWIRARILSSQYERPPRLIAVRANTVPALQAETARDEVLGGSDGSPNQTLRLAHAPVIDGSLVLEVDEGLTSEAEGGTPPAWTSVPDLLASRPDDRHYVLNRTTGEVHFGDGTNGRIPLPNVDKPGINVVARTYRFGGGKGGNLPAGAIKDALNPVDGINGGGVKNLLPSHSGRDEESLREAKKRAPGSLRSRDRAVTPEDFEHFARQAGTIRRAKALPLFHPDFPDTRVPGVVTVIVVPDSDQPRPTPSEGTLRTVCALLDRKRLLTTEVYVIPPTYRQVRVQAEVVAADDADLAALKKGIEDTLLSYFHPLVGGEDGTGWPFGGDIAYSRVYQRVFTVPGVQRIERLALVVDGEECPACRDVVLPAAMLVFSTQHDVDVRYDFGE